MGKDGKLDPALLQELAELKLKLNAVDAEMRRPSMARMMERHLPPALVSVDTDLCSEDSDQWPMEWDECWEERWAVVEEMLVNNKAFKDKVMRILSQTSIKV